MTPALGSAVKRGRGHKSVVKIKIDSKRVLFINTQLYVLNRRLPRHTNSSTASRYTCSDRAPNVEKLWARVCVG